MDDGRNIDLKQTSGVCYNSTTNKVLMKHHPSRCSVYTTTASRQELGRKPISFWKANVSPSSLIFRARIRTAARYGIQPAVYHRSRDSRVSGGARRGGGLCLLAQVALGKETAYADSRHVFPEWWWWHFSPVRSHLLIRLRSIIKRLCSFLFPLRCRWGIGKKANKNIKTIAAP